MTFSPVETAACYRLIELALKEDLGSAGDLTSEALLSWEQKGQAVLVARQPGVLAGMPAALEVFSRFDLRLPLEAQREDGSFLQPGDQLALIQGRMGSILAAERTALNFVQRLSGVATQT